MPATHDPQSLRATALVQGCRVEILRAGARVRVRSRGRTLAESDARRAAERVLGPGERLLRLVEQDPPGVSFTYVVWPRVPSHTRALLDGRRHAA